MNESLNQRRSECLGVAVYRPRGSIFLREKRTRGTYPGCRAPSLSIATMRPHHIALHRSIAMRLRAAARLHWSVNPKEKKGTWERQKQLGVMIVDRRHVSPTAYTTYKRKQTSDQPCGPQQSQINNNVHEHEDMRKILIGLRHWCQWIQCVGTQQSQINNNVHEHEDIRKILIGIRH